MHQSVEYSDKLKYVCQHNNVSVTFILFETSEKEDIHVNIFSETPYLSNVKVFFYPTGIDIAECVMGQFSPDVLQMLKKDTTLKDVHVIAKIFRTKEPAIQTFSYITKNCLVQCLWKFYYVNSLNASI